jgi:flagellin
MSLVVNTNVGSLSAQRSLAASGAELKTAMERLSSGSKINSASDDAAGFAIAERMTSQIRGLNMAAKNAGDGLSMLSAIENATNDVTDMLQRMRELAVQAVNDTNTEQDREYLQSEVNALLSEINRVAGQTEYNGETILDGTRSGKIQVGTEQGQTVGFDIKSITTASLDLTDSVGAYKDAAGVTVNAAADGQPPASAVSFVAHGGGTDGLAWTNSLTGPEVSAQGSTISVLNAADASAALGKIADAIEQVAGDRAGYGALQNRLEYTVSNLMNVSEFTSAAKSRIEDADFAVESARLAKAQVLQQSGTAMLAQANASSQLALSLIR